MEQIVIIDHGPAERFPDEHRLLAYKLMGERCVGELICLLGPTGLRNELGERIVPSPGRRCCGPAQLPTADEQPLTGPLTCVVEYARVAEVYQRRRFGHEMMFELERRWPGVICTRPTMAGAHSIPSWYSLREKIMRTDNPHVGRDDLPAYVPMRLPSARQNAT